MANKTLDGSANVHVWFMQLLNRTKNKAIVNNYTFITCVFKKNNSIFLLVEWKHAFPSPSKQVDKFDKLVIQGNLKWMIEWNKAKKRMYEKNWRMLVLGRKNLF